MMGTQDVKTANAPTEKGLAMAASARPKADVLGASNRQSISTHMSSCPAL